MHPNLVLPHESFFTYILLMMLGLIFLFSLLAFASAAENAAKSSTNETENRMVACMLLYYSKWKEISANSPFNSTEGNDMRFKAKAMMMRRCFDTMPQSIINKALPALS